MTEPCPCIDMTNDSHASSSFERSSAFTAGKRARIELTAPQMPVAPPIMAEVAHHDVSMLIASEPPAPINGSSWPLHTAVAQRNHATMRSLLLVAAADMVNSIHAESGCSPIDLAVSGGDLLASKMLFAAGAQVDGYTLELARSSGNSAVEMWLRCMMLADVIDGAAGDAGDAQSSGMGGALGALGAVPTQRTVH